MVQRRWVEIVQVLDGNPKSDIMAEWRREKGGCLELFSCWFNDHQRDVAEWRREHDSTLFRCWLHNIESDMTAEWLERDGPLKLLSRWMNDHERDMLAEWRRENDLSLFSCWVSGAGQCVRLSEQAPKFYFEHVGLSEACSGDRHTVVGQRPFRD